MLVGGYAMLDGLSSEYGNMKRQRKLRLRYCQLWDERGSGNPANLRLPYNECKICLEYFLPPRVRQGDGDCIQP